MQHLTLDQLASARTLCWGGTWRFPRERPICVSGSGLDSGAGVRRVVVRPSDAICLNVRHVCSFRIRAVVGAFQTLALRLRGGPGVPSRGVSRHPMWMGRPFPRRFSNDLRLVSTFATAHAPNTQAGHAVSDPHPRIKIMDTPALGWHRCPALCTLGSERSPSRSRTASTTPAPSASPSPRRSRLRPRPCPCRPFVSPSAAASPQPLEPQCMRSPQPAGSPQPTAVHEGSSQPMCVCVVATARIEATHPLNRRWTRAQLASAGSERDVGSARERGWGWGEALGGSYTGRSPAASP